MGKILFFPLKKKRFISNSGEVVVGVLKRLRFGEEIAFTSYGFKEEIISLGGVVGASMGYRYLEYGRYGHCYTIT